MDSCRHCATVLTDANWYSSHRAMPNRICKDCHKQRMVVAHHANRNGAKQRHRKWNFNLKLQVVMAYGGQCQCCGEERVEFLSIDHIHNDGSAHRKELGLETGQQFYQWLKRQGFPKDRFQLLCYNCNYGKKVTGVCPHVYPYVVRQED